MLRVRGAILMTSSKFGIQRILGGLRQGFEED